MNATVRTENLVWLVQTASRPIPSRSTLPSVKGCLIEALSDRLVFSGTNLDWGVKVSAEASVTSSGSLVVSSKILEDVVKTLTSPTVNLSLDQAAWALTVRAGDSEMVLNAVPPDDFPSWPGPQHSESIAVPKSLFRDLVRAGATCAVSNPARPLWGACLIEFKDDQVVMVSTDQFALSRGIAPVSAPEGRAIMSAAVLQDIARLSERDESEDMAITMGENHIYFSSNTMSCFSRLIEGQYYAYEQVIPKTFVSSVTVPTERLLRACSRASILASEEDRAMRIILDSRTGTLTVKAGSPEKGRMDESMPVGVKGESVEIWVQYRYMLQALGKIGTEETFLGISGQVSPMKVEPVAGDDGKKGPEVAATYVIMPMSSPKGAF